MGGGAGGKNDTGTDTIGLGGVIIMGRGDNNVFFRRLRELKIARWGSPRLGLHLGASPSKSWEFHPLYLIWNC